MNEEDNVNKICIYEAKIDKQEEIEELMKEVAECYKCQPGVIDTQGHEKYCYLLGIEVGGECAPPNDAILKTIPKTIFFRKE